MKSIQLGLFAPRERVSLCERLGSHFWAIDGANNCDCGREIVGPWNMLEFHDTPGTPLKTAVSQELMVPEMERL